MIRLRLKSPPPVRIDVSALLPEHLAALAPAEIERLALRVGNRAEHVGDWFTVAGDPADHLVLEGDCARLDRIGAGMSSGTLTVAGDAGASLGLGMTGGTLAVEGGSGPGAATDLRGGRLSIAGDAGAGVGGALPGERRGMRGGIVTIGGTAGDRLGDRLARGLVVVAGDAGIACGSRMVAGTIVVLGRVGAHAGFAMRRGSIIALGGAARLGAGFADTGTHDFVYLRVLARTLAPLGVALAAERLIGLRRLAGDLATGGKGEILLPG